MKTSRGTVTIMINVHDDHNARQTDINVRNCRLELHHRAVFPIFRKNSAHKEDSLAIRIDSVLYTFIASKQLQ